MPKLSIIIASTRPGRVGLPVAQWFLSRATAHGGFTAELVDLAAVNLPMFDEPKHPRSREYVHAHTERWSATVAAADAFAFVLAEYNHGVPAPLVNALTYLAHEWAYKPAMLVSYGGVSGGTRSAEMTRQILASLKVVALADAVNIPFISGALQDGAYHGSPRQDDATRAALDELVRWERALRTLRT